MLFTGTHPRSLDDKQRLALPKRIRDGLGQSPTSPLYLTPGTDGSLALYTEEGFARLGQQLAQGSPAGQDNRAFSRLFYAQAEAVEVDSQGRIRIPQELIQLARLGREVMLLGVRDHMELWDKARWDEYLEDRQQRYDELAENAFDQSVGVKRSAAPVETAIAEDSSRPSHPR
jgi:MraZ protein